MPTAFVNPLRRDPLAFHRRLPGYAPTRIVDTPGLAAELGLAQLWVKDEASRLGLPAFKILGASWATYRMLVERLGHEPPWETLDELRQAFAPLGPLTLAAATDGNHGRAVAHMARLLGYDARIFVPAGTAAARVDSIEGEGATVTVVDGTYDDAVATSAAIADAQTLVVSDTSWPGYEAVPRWVIDGYSTMFRELPPTIEADLVIVQMGVGALTAAAVDWFEGRAMVVVVEPDTAACGLAAARAGGPVDVPGPHDSIMAGLNCGRVSLVAWPVVARGVDLFVTISDDDATRAMRDLASCGVVAGETGAAGLGGLRSALAAQALDPTGRRALVINTEGATDPVAYEEIVGKPPR
jgi:diaminopropionate ammonia-lyase